MKVENEAKVNQVQDPVLLLKKYQKEVKDLKQELMMHDQLAGTGRVSYDSITAEQQYEIQLKAESFLKGEKDEIEEITSMRQVRELFAQMRNYYFKLKQDDKQLLDAAEALLGRGGIQSAGKDMTQDAPDDENRIGEIEDRGQFGLGVAPKDSRPVNKIELTKEQEAEFKEA